MKLKNKTTLWIRFALALQIGFLSPFEIVWAQESQRPRSSPAAVSTPPDFNLKALQDLDPNLREFAESRPLRSPFLPVDAQDPNLDQDPYFLRNQKWVAPIQQPLEVSEATAFEAHSASSITVQLGGTKHSLRIEQPLAPVFESADFLFLQATTSEIFKSKARKDEDYGEGLFFIDKRLLRTESSRNQLDHPVPIYFLPLNGRGWSTKVEAISIGANETIAFQNAENDFAAVDADQMHVLATLSQNNLVFATIMALKNDPQLAKIAQVSLQNQFAQARTKSTAIEGVELPFAYPPRGSTAAFGTFFTGVNLEHPEQSIDEVINTQALNLRALFLPEAHANDVFTPDLVARLLLIGKVTGTVYMTGLMAQFTVLRQRMLERRALIEKLQDEDDAKNGRAPRERTGRLFRLKRAFVESIDVWVHGLNSLSSAATTGSGFLAEYASDRFLGDAARTDNGLIRRFLKWTFLYNRRQNENIAADARSFYLGSIILGGIDTAGVALQLGYVSAHFFPWVAHTFFGSDIQNRIDAQFKGSQADNANNLRSELMRNFSGYIVNGASSYSSQLRTQFQEVLRPQVAREFLRQGKNPDDPHYAKEVEKRMEELLDFTMVSRGLPSRSKFLFSAPNLYRKIAGLMGYRVDDTSNPYEKQDASFSEKAKIQLARLMNNVVLKSYFVLAGIDPNNTQPGFDGFKPESINERLIKYYWGLDEKYQLSKSNAKSQIEDTFLFESARWGIIGHVLKMAQQNAQSFSNIYPDNLDAKVAVEILKKSTDDFHAIYQIMKNPLNAGQALKDGYRVRKMLTLLSYEGPVIGDTVKYVDYWPEAKSNPKAAQMAGRIFRQSLFAVANNKPYYLAPDEAFLKANIDQARAEAEKELSAADPSIGFTDVDREILALEKVKALYEKSEAEKMAAAWKPESGDFVEKFQHQMAARRAEARSSTREEYQEAYREELAKIVGLHVQPIDQSPLVRKAVETARESISANLQSSAGWQKYLAGLDEEGQFQFLTQQYADAFLASYLNLTLGNSQYTGLTSNEQPGRFQRARIALTGGNDNWFKKSLRVSLRFIESPWNNSSFKPGLGSLIVRNIPLSGDIWTDIKQRVRSIWVAGTVGYLSQYYIWQVKFQWPTYLFFFSTLTFVAATSYWIDRLMMNIGVKPMSSVTGKGVYSWFYTWLTYPTYIPFFFFLPYWQKFYTNYVAVPFTQYVSSPVAEHVLTPVIETCSKLLGGH